MYRYRLFKEDGSDAGEAHSFEYVSAWEVIRNNDGQLLRVLDVVATLVDTEDQIGLLAKVTHASPPCRYASRCLL